MKDNCSYKCKTYKPQASYFHAIKHANYTTKAMCSTRARTRTHTHTIDFLAKTQKALGQNSSEKSMQ